MDTLPNDEDSPIHMEGIDGGRFPQHRIVTISAHAKIFRTIFD